MRSTTYATLDFQKPNFATVYAVQDDQLTRWVHADLTDGGEAWAPPSGTLMTIRYKKPDGTGGWYDSLEDGGSAYAISGSAVDFGFAAQCLTVPGIVLVELNFWNAKAERLSAFLFRLQVEKNPLTDAEMESSDYYNVLNQKIAAVLGATTHPPQIDPTNKNWLLWDEDLGGYADSGFSSVGTTGPAPQITSQVRTWQGSSSGTTIPSGSWSSTIPAAVPGQYLWSRTILTYDNGQTVTLYAVAYQGQDGQGAPGSQLPRMDGTASAGSANAYSREDHVHPTGTFAKTVTFSAAGTTSLTDLRFTADHRLVGYQFFDSSNNVSGDILADITITTAAGSCSVTINTVYNAGSVVLTFAYAPASN